MTSEILLLIWCGGVLALGTFVLVGRLTDGYERSFMGAVSSSLLVILALAYAVGFPYLAELIGRYAPRIGSPDPILLFAVAPALVFAIPACVVAPVRALFLLVTIYAALLGQHYLPPLFPTVEPPLLQLGLRMLITLVVSTPVFLSLFGRAGWTWLIPFAFAVQLTGPLVVAALFAAPAPTGETTPAAPDPMMLHLTASLGTAAMLMPIILAFLALRRRPYGERA